MDIKDLQGKMVAVLGFGMEGRAVTAYLLKHGITPVLFDAKPWDEWTQKDQEFIKSLGLNFIFGPDYFKELSGFDVAFRSPGLPLSHPDLQKWSLVDGHILTSQTKWFFEHCSAKIIGVTGTKGKGTTATLIYEILKSQITNDKYQIYLTGNIGKLQPFDFIDEIKKDDHIVYELSSFQLQDLTRSPHIGVVLMTTSEHLNYHADVAEYRSAKEPIVKFQGSEDFCIYNSDYEGSVGIANTSGARKIEISRFKLLNTGCFVENNMVVVKNILGENFEFPVSHFLLQGKHNLENICAAVAASICAGVQEKNIQTAVENFKGLEHRLEYVSEKEGIAFYNDSISTTPESAIAAVQSFSAPMVLILGGSTKHSDFGELGKTIAGAKNVKALILIGDEAERIKKSVLDNHFSGTILEGARSMLEIFQQIHQLARAGDVVVLSPACTSFGMFTSYKDRGEQFKQQVGLF